MCTGHELSPESTKILAERRKIQREVGRKDLLKRLQERAEKFDKTDPNGINIYWDMLTELQ